MAPEHATVDGSRESVNLLWGMVRIVEEPEAQRIELLWGMVSVSVGTRRMSAPDIQEGEASVPVDPVQAAIARTQERMANFQAACIIGSVSAALFWLSRLSSAKPTWAAIWFVGGLVSAAVASGLVLTVFGEGLRRRWLKRELADATAQRDAHRAVASGQTEAVQELTASIAHEIRNPITAAKSLVQQMGEDPANVENVEYAGVALAELERVERSVSHLLRFGRDEQIEPADIDLADALQSAVAAVDERARSCGVRLTIESDTAGPIRGDAEKLHRVFLNLLTNALDAMENADTPAAELAAQLGENLAGTEVWARVKDNGPGIEPGRIAKIWTPFHTSKETGTGLGLPICRKLVEGHGGTIDVSSLDGAGADFVLTFPKRV